MSDPYRDRQGAAKHHQDAGLPPRRAGSGPALLGSAGGPPSDAPAIGRCHTGGRGPSPSWQGSGNGLLGGPAGGLPEPELLAAKLAVNVKPELFDDLVAVAAAAASVQTDPQLKVYWEKVHHALKP